MLMYVSDKFLIKLTGLGCNRITRVKQTNRLATDY